jgi:hypothetical protein
MLRRTIARGAAATMILLAATSARAADAPLEDEGRAPTNERPALSATAIAEAGFTPGPALRIAYAPTPKVALGIAGAYSHLFAEDTSIAMNRSGCTSENGVHHYRINGEVRPLLARGPAIELWMPFEFGALDRHGWAKTICPDGSPPARATGDSWSWLLGTGLVIDLRVGRYVSLDLELRARLSSLDSQLQPLVGVGIGLTAYLPL